MPCRRSLRCSSVHEWSIEAVGSSGTSVPPIATFSSWQPRQIARRATILAAVLMALYYMNYEKGWVTVADLDVTKYIL